MTQDEASRRIAAILAELERTTWQRVRSIRIDNLPVATICQPGPAMRAVVIELDPLPGLSWQT